MLWFFFPPVMNRLSLEAYPLLSFISPSLFPPLLPPSLSLLLSLSPSSSKKPNWNTVFFFSATVPQSCCSSLSVQMMWKRLKVIPFLANPAHYVTVTLFYMWHMRVFVYVGQSHIASVCVCVCALSISLQNRICFLISSPGTKAIKSSSPAFSPHCVAALFLSQLLNSIVNYYCLKTETWSLSGLLPSLKCCCWGFFFLSFSSIPRIITRNYPLCERDKCRVILFSLSGSEVIAILSETGLRLNMSQMWCVLISA